MTSLHRRSWLRIGSLAGLAGALGASEPGSFGRAKHCILLFLTGGPPQHDTIDPKPLAPANIRGEFAPIDTSVPGIQVSELFPQVARRVDRLTLVRSVSHHDTVHTSAGYTMLTGWGHPLANTPSAADIKPLPTDHPHFGSIMTMMRSSLGIPPFVSIPEIIKDAAINEFPGLNGGFLGNRYSPLLVEGSAATGQFSPPPLQLPETISPTRFSARQDLLSRLSQGSRFQEESLQTTIHQELQDRAVELLKTSKLKDAFDLERESPTTRDRYGSNLFGRGCLMARRLVEAGVGLVSVYWHYEGPDDSPVWDTHGNNFEHLRKRLCPSTDPPLAALLDDLAVRGFLDETLLIVMGEFGRTPQVNNLAGRDHWPHVASVLLAGAGVPAGSLYGSSDKDGAYPRTDAVSPADLTATFLHLLGIPHDLEIHDQSGRPYRAIEGTPIPGLISG